MSAHSPRDAERDARDIARDARRERLLIPQALIALIVVAAVVVLRELLLR
ncbi:MULTISPECIES: hypothetical protein [Microbacterium]|jgi:hypothetical protein|nr:hypothetical protein [Microbacterium nymphoidis]MCD2499608.1 hypothetical protein [Microbacterium nymphoidis]